MRYRHHYLWLACTCAAAASASAQEPGQRVTGIVFDSVAGAPLAGATVQIVGTGSNGRTYFGAVADSMGRFRVDGVPLGDYVIGFDHLSLRALGLETPVSAVRVTAAGPVEVTLAIPSAETVRAARCGGGAPRAADGLIAGFVRDADNQVALVGATVDVRWNEIVIVPGRATFQHRRAFGIVGESGAYAVCGIPSDARLTLQVTARKHVGGSVELELPPGGAARQDMTVADSASVTVFKDGTGTSRLRGTAQLTGRVRLRNGRPAEGARVLLPELGLETEANASGAFVFNTLPPGSWMVEARSIGWEPVSKAASLSSGRTATISLTFDASLAVLGTVLVKGEKTRVAKLLEQLIHRKMVGGGTIFIAGDPALEAAHHVTDVLRSARGFLVTKEEDGGGVTITGRGSGSMTNETGKCSMQIYLNGEPMSPGFKDIDVLLQPKEVLAIEAYNSFETTPIEYRHQYTCGAIVFWTKR